MPGSPVYTVGLNSEVFAPPDGYPPYLSRWAIPVAAATGAANGGRQYPFLCPETWSTTYQLSETDLAWMLVALSLVLDQLQPGHPNVFTYINAPTGLSYPSYIKGLMETRGMLVIPAGLQGGGFLEFPYFTELQLGGGGWTDAIGNILETVIKYVPVVGQIETIALNYANSQTAKDMQAALGQTLAASETGLTAVDNTVAATPGAASAAQQSLATELSNAAGTAVNYVQSNPILLYVLIGVAVLIIVVIAIRATKK